MATDLQQLRAHLASAGAAPGDARGADAAAGAAAPRGIPGAPRSRHGPLGRGGAALAARSSRGRRGGARAGGGDPLFQPLE